MKPAPVLRLLLKPFSEAGFLRESNPLQIDYKSIALPDELRIVVNMGVEPIPRVLHTRALPQSQITHYSHSRTAVRAGHHAVSRKPGAPRRTHEPHQLTVRSQRILCAVPGIDAPAREML